MSATAETLRLDPLRGLDHQSVDSIHAAVERVFAAAGLARPTRFATATVVEELCTNIMEHSQADWLELTLTPHDRSARVRIRDNGRSFDPSRALREQPAELAGRADEERRLGLFLIRQLARRLRHSRGEDGVNLVEFEVAPGLDDSTAT